MRRDWLVLFVAEAALSLVLAYLAYVVSPRHPGVALYGCVISVVGFGFAANAARRYARAPRELGEE